jgi:nucleoporin SEH1
MADGQVEIMSPSDTLRREWLQRHIFGADQSKDANPDRRMVSASLSWNRYPYDHRSMIVAHGETAQIWRMDRERRKWKQAVLTTPISHARVINHVAWAPNMGRSYHLVATASSDGTVKLWSVKSQVKEAGASVLGTGTLSVELVQTLAHKSRYADEDVSTPCEVFRVQWNLTASCLSTTTDDGAVYLWTPNFKGEWTLQREVTS